MDSSPRIAVLIPCHNEALTIGKVVDDFRAQLPEATVYVFDNCCTDSTADIATQHGAKVIVEPRKGKGYVIGSMFNLVQADYYVMVDGDDTYPASDARKLLEPVIAGNADMVVGARLSQYDGESFRSMHVLGNNLVRRLINRIFDARLTDILSGYRAFSSKVVRHVPVVSSGFEVETELTVQMLYYRMTIAEVQVPYKGRPAGSVSKLHTFRDGARVLWTIFNLFRAVKPLTFFGSVAIVLFLLGLFAGTPPIVGFIQTGKVLRFPLAILATGLMILSGGCGFLGVLLHAINWRFKELHNVMVRGRD